MTDTLGSLNGDITPTVGDFFQLSEMTFAASAGYSLVGSGVSVCIFAGKYSSPYFRIDYTEDDAENIDWDTAEGELLVTIQPEDWGDLVLRDETTLLVRVQIQIPDASPVTFWGSLDVRPAVVAPSP